MNTDIAYVGYLGTGIFLQEGGTHRVCERLLIGDSPDANGRYVLAGGDLMAPRVSVGEKGRGTFTQSDGNHRVAGTLSIAEEGNSVGLYDLQGGNLFAGEISVGGSPTAKGGAGTFAISGGHAGVNGELVIWEGSTAHLGEGTLAGLDGNHPYVDVENGGTLYIESGVYCLGTLRCMGSGLSGSVVVNSGATLWVESIRQGSLTVEAGAEVHFAGENYDLFMTLARENQRLVPEPGTLALIGLGGLLLARRRRGLPGTARGPRGGAGRVAA